MDVPVPDYVKLAPQAGGDMGAHSATSPQHWPPPSRARRGRLRAWLVKLLRDCAFMHQVG